MGRDGHRGYDEPFFEVADYESEFIFSKLKMTNLIWWTFENSINLFDILYSGVFPFADYESEIGFSKFKMADLIWRPLKRKFHPLILS